MKIKHWRKNKRRWSNLAGEQKEKNINGRGWKEEEEEEESKRGGKAGGAWQEEQGKKEEAKERKIMRMRRRRKHKTNEARSSERVLRTRGSRSSWGSRRGKVERSCEWE